MKQKTIDMLKAKAAAYEAAAQADTAYADGYREVASMFLEILGRADDMSPLDFADHASRAVFAAYQWEDTMGPDAFVPEYQYDTP